MAEQATAVLDEEPPAMRSRRRPSDKPSDKPPRPFPYVCVGMVVLWYHHGIKGVPPVPAVVTAVGERAIDLSRMHDDGPFEAKQAVRHLHEKDVPDIIREESGGWDYTDFHHTLIGYQPKLREWPGEKPAKAKAAD